MTRVSSPSGTRERTDIGVTTKKRMIMEEVIDNIMEYIKKKTDDFTYMDQTMIYDELAGRLDDMSADALKNEYLTNNVEVMEHE